ncbi:lysophospholipase [Oceanibacterium hippocampi]|uniref:Alpha/beta hydrolase family protein n=1 Tax=Oceanibacterium hippocampi TaxID=745714 RepID=A0A1Y5TWX3_9PROT|nr:lysophospholipase [Oceanibacterium hippocampi]SLN75750.1 Alpha/beta hydrolase family protein [Oceanibacterium hippocampi]
MFSKSYWRGTKICLRESVDGYAVGRPVALNAPDTARLRGIYWTPKSNPSPKVAVIASHPRVDFSEHHAFPGYLKAGYACLGANPRYVNNDLDCIHEKILVDIATYMVWLKQQGVEKIILLGNSGGGSLFSFYQQQAVLPPSRRITLTPGGKRTYLEKTEMPPGDALIYMAAHIGQGLIINEVIDPSVVDEQDPLKTDPELDMYDPRNGFAPPPEWSRYSPEFVTRFRAAQLARVRRLDAIAHDMLNDGEAAGAVCTGPDFANLSADMQRHFVRRELHQPIMVIHRTLANLHYTDNSLDPSPRGYGSLISPRPDLANFQRFGFARVMSPDGWLSTWSGLSSNASVPKTAGSVTVPALVIHAARDLDIYPITHSRTIYEALGASDKALWDIPDALHYFDPATPDEGNRTLDGVMARLTEWTAERFPV